VGILDRLLGALNPSGPWAAHEARAGELVASLESAGAFRRVHGSVGTLEWSVRLEWDDGSSRFDAFAAHPPETVGSALMLMVRGAESGLYPHNRYWGGKDPVRATWVVTRPDAVLAARTAIGTVDDWEMAWPLLVATAMLEVTQRADPSPDEVEAIEGLLASIGERTLLLPEERRNLRRRLRALRPDRAGDGVDESVIAPTDTWSALVIPAFLACDPREPAALLLRHLDSAKGSKPAARWLARARELLADPGAEQFLRVSLTALSEAPVRPLSRGPLRGLARVLDPANSDIARACAWASSQVVGGWPVPVLAAVAHRGLAPASMRAVAPDVDPFSGDKVLNACVLALGLVGTSEAVSELQRLSLTTRHQGVRARIAAALEAAADRAGLTRGQLVERMVPTEGFGLDGVRHLEDSAHAARLVLEPPGVVRVEWLVDGAWVARSPAGVEAAETSAARRALKTARDAVSAERRRIEDLLAAEGSWSLDDWRVHYRDHPVTGTLAARLIWRFEVDSTTSVVGMPTGDGRLVTPVGTAAIPDGSRVSLWHLARATTDEVQAWRGWLLDGDVRQPFKQAFREVYLLTPAEVATVRYSNRFAAHVVRYQQMYALTKERAWVSNYLGPYDGGYDGAARRDLADCGLTAVLQFQAVDTEEAHGRVDHALTDRVWFFRTGDRQREPVPLEDVPVLAFSEAMRDVDLFVGVCSIALDPEWGLREGDAHYGYWRQTSFGDLTARGDVRRDVLTSLVPRLKVHDRVEVLDRYVRVRGSLATYRIHLGSANILVEPDDRYLCIIPDGRTKGPRLMLPFEGDEILSLILSKIVLLAADDRITDETILRQIRRR